MSKINALGPGAPEFKALTDAEWDAWRSSPITRRLAGWLQESVAAAEKEREERRARAAKSLEDPGGRDYACARRDFNEINGGLFRLGQVLVIIEGPASVIAPEGEAA